MSALKRYGLAMGVGATIALLLAEWWRRRMYRESYLPPVREAEQPTTDEPRPATARVRTLAALLQEPIVASGRLTLSTLDGIRRRRRRLRSTPATDPTGERPAAGGVTSETA